MAITATLMEASQSTVSATSFNTGSLAATLTSDLGLIWIYNRQGAGTASIPTVSGTNGWGGIWTQVDTLTFSGAVTARCTLFRSLATSTSAGALTITTTAASMGLQWSWLAISGHNSTGANQGVIQSTGATATASTGTVTLGAFGSSSNGTVFGLGLLSSRALTAKTSYTDGAAYQVAATMGTAGSEWIGGSDTAPSMSWSTQGTATYGAIGAEVALFIASGAAARARSRMLRGVGV